MSKTSKNLQELSDKIEYLASCSKYNEQGGEFVRATCTSIKGSYKGLRNDHFGGGDTEYRDIWTITISRTGRSFSFDFGSSISDTEYRIQAILPSNYQDSVKRLRKEPESIGWHFATSRRFKVWETENKKEKELKERNDELTFSPTYYDILACLTKYEPADNIDDFAAEFGIEKISEAVKTYEAVKTEYNSLKLLFNESELEVMQLIN